MRSSVATTEEAEAARFRGSPTVLFDGRDPFASGDERIGLTCRVYETPDGPAASPTIEQLEALLERRDRGLASVAAVAMIVCYGGSALAAGLVGGAALAAVRQFTAVTLVGLGLAVLVARELERPSHHRAPSDPLSTADRSPQVQGTPR